MKKKQDLFTIDVQLNPRLRVASLPVKFRDSKGRFCKPAKGASFEVTPPGKRKALKGEIPKAARSSIKNRKAFVASVLVEYSRQKEVKRQKTESKRVKQAIKTQKKKKPSKARAKKEARELQELTQAQEEALLQAGIETPPPATPKLDKLVAVSRQSEKYVLGRDPAHKRQTEKHAESRTGVKDYQGRYMEIEKINVDFDSNKPVEIFSFNAKAAALSLREYFRPHAEKFMDQMRGRTEEAYIMRVKTLNRMEGEKPKREGVGTERFRVSRSIPKEQLKVLRQEFPKMTDAQILREIQLSQLAKKLEDLFDYFVERYESYLGRRVVNSMAVTGFSMEVVKGVMT